MYNLPGILTCSLASVTFGEGILHTACPTMLSLGQSCDVICDTINDYSPTSNSSTTQYTCTSTGQLVAPTLTCVKYVCRMLSMVLVDVSVACGSTT